MKFSAFWKRYVRVSDGTGLVAPVPHREQARYLAAVDSGKYREALLHWGKKSAKSFTAAARALHHLVAEDREPEDRLVAVASFDEEQSRIIFEQVRQLVDRHPHLRARVRLLKNEAVYEEEVLDKKTGGTFRRVHRLRALARDVKGTHGEPWSLVCRDELWSEPSHEMSEALIPSPNRRHSEILYTTYSGLATMAKPGVPLFDLLTRVRAHDASLFYSYIGGTGPDASWEVAPWVTREWVEQQRQIFAASPSRFRRVVLNEQVLGDGDGLLTHDELRAAMDASLPTVPTPLPGVQYVGGLDLGVSIDHSALVVGHLDGEANFVVDVCRVWRPTAGAIALAEVEAGVRAVAARFRLASLHTDQWNAKLLVERLQQARVPARLVSVEQAMLNKIVTSLKSAFAQRAMRIHPSETFLLEQLESLKVLETRTPRRDYLKFAPSGTGLDASQHDDCAVALGLCLVQFEGRIGRVVMDPQRACNWELNGRHMGADCYLAGGTHTPFPSDPLCRDCPGHQSTRRALARYEARQGPLPGGLREFIRIGGIAPNRWVLDARIRANLAL